MKKKILALAALLTLCATGNAFAAFAWPGSIASSYTWGATANGPQLTVAPSANVALGYESTSGISYSLGSFHSSGTKSYATTSNETRIYMFENATQTLAAAEKAPNDPNSTSAMTSWGTGWTALK